MSYTRRRCSCLNIATVEASHVSAPSALRVETARAATAEEVSPAGRVSLRVYDISFTALGTVAVGLLNFTKLQLVHNPLVVVDP